MGRKKDHFSIFSVSFSFFGKELENERKMKSPSFYPHFNFFLFLFFRFMISFALFSLFFLIRKKGMREGMNSIAFSV